MNWPTVEPWGIRRGMEREPGEDRDGRAGPGAAACCEESPAAQSNHVGQTQQVSPGESRGDCQMQMEALTWGGHWSGVCTARTGIRASRTGREAWTKKDCGWCFSRIRRKKKAQGPKDPRRIWRHCVSRGLGMRAVKEIREHSATFQGRSSLQVRIGRGCLKEG